MGSCADLKWILNVSYMSVIVKKNTYRLVNKWKHEHAGHILADKYLSINRAKE